MLLNEEEIADRLSRHPGWSVDGKHIWKRYECKNFGGAISFVNLLAKEAEEMDHHPDILISNWNRVTIHITTHSADGLTESDFKLATRIDSAFKSSA